MNRPPARQQLPGWAQNVCRSIDTDPTVWQRMRLLSRMRYVWATRNLCRWCDGTGIFHMHLPLACPVCGGTGWRRGAHERNPNA